MTLQHVWFRKWTAAAFLVGSLAPAASGAAMNFLRDPGFEAPSSRWQTFIPADSGAAQPRLSIEPEAAHTGKRGAVLSANTSARFGAFPMPQYIGVRPGEKYRLSAWIKPGPKFAAEPGTPGVVLRATLLTPTGEDHPDGHIFIGLSGTTNGDPLRLAARSIPDGWTQLEGTMVIPKGAARMVFFLFLWKASGALYVDDVAVERL